MKSKIFMFWAFIITFVSFSQTREKGVILRTEPNGVVVYKPIDVEHTLGIKPEKYSVIEAQTQIPSIKTINDYTLEELESILPDVDLKIQKHLDENDDPQEIERCREYKKSIEQRIEKLKTSEG